jgi:hypothetical protein
MYAAIGRGTLADRFARETARLEGFRVASGL